MKKETGQLLLCPLRGKITKISSSSPTAVPNRHNCPESHAVYANRTDLALDQVPTTEGEHKPPPLMAMVPRLHETVELRSPKTTPPWERLTPVKRNIRSKVSSFKIND
jgi:hypothetical protein